MNHFFESRIIIGINAPTFAWVAAGIVLFFAFVAMVWLSIRARAISVSGKRLSRLLSSLKRPTLGNGLSLSEVETMKGYFDKSPHYRRTWAKLQNNLMRRRGRIALETIMSLEELATA